METQETKLKAKIAQLRENYARLRDICGPRGINRETTERYSREIRALLAQLGNTIPALAN